jgi:hypothetical protein
MFNHMQGTLQDFLTIGDRITRQNGDVWGMAMAIIKGIALQIVYFVLTIVFIYVFVMAIWSFHMLLFVVPIAAALAAIKGARKYLLNIFTHGLVFILTPVFGSIAMAITISLLSDLSDQATKTSFMSGELTHLPELFYIKSMLLGILSIFFHLKATSFASMVVGTPDSGFGQIFGASVAAGSGALMLAKTGLGKAVSGGVGATQGWKEHSSGGFGQALKSGSMSQAAGYAMGSAIQGPGKAAISGIQKGRAMLFGDTPNPDKS